MSAVDYSALKADCFGNGAADRIYLAAFDLGCLPELSANSTGLLDVIRQGALAQGEVEPAIFDAMRQRAAVSLGVTSEALGATLSALAAVPGLAELQSAYAKVLAAAAATLQRPIKMLTPVEARRNAFTVGEDFARPAEPLLLCQLGVDKFALLVPPMPVHDEEADKQTPMADLVARARDVPQLAQQVGACCDELLRLFDGVAAEMSEDEVDSARDDVREVADRIKSAVGDATVVVGVNGNGARCARVCDSSVRAPIGKYSKAPRLASPGMRILGLAVLPRPDTTHPRSSRACIGRQEYADQRAAAHLERGRGDLLDPRRRIPARGRALLQRRRIPADRARAARRPRAPREAQRSCCSSRQRKTRQAPRQSTGSARGSCASTTFPMRTARSTA
jgi:hypothetical protein